MKVASLSEILLQLNWTINCWRQFYLIFHFFSKLFFVYEHKCHFRIFFIKRCRFHVVFPTDYKKKTKHAAGRRTFSVASHLKTRINIILHCKTFIPITYMTISFTSACRARAPFDRCLLTTSLLPDWITITAPSPQWGGLLFKHKYTGRLSIPNHSLGIANSFFPLHRV